MYDKYIKYLGGKIMSVRTYEKEEKQAYVEDYKNSGETLAKYALEKEYQNQH